MTTSNPISENYGFYAAMLRFVTQKSDQSDLNVRAIMLELEQIAAQIMEGPQFSIRAARSQVISRGFAGVAHFLQHRILPEAQAHGDQKALGQINWAIATSLQLGRAVILHLDQFTQEEIPTAFIDIELPPLDRIPGHHAEDEQQTVH